MMTNKKIFIISIVVIIIGISTFLLYILRPNQITPPTQTQVPMVNSKVPTPIDQITPSTQTKTPTINSKVTISVDKSVYNEGEIISIIVNNGLEGKILYIPNGDRFWGIEYYKENEWKKFGYEDRQGFQLTNKNIGDNCYIALYELPYPTELQTQSNLKSQWNQKICSFDTGGADKPKIVQFMESGKYRFTFSYGFEIHENDPFRILEPKTIYSDTITIK